MQPVVKSFQHFKDESLEISTTIATDGLAIPCHQDISEENISKINSVIESFIKKAEKNRISLKKLREIVIGTNSDILPSGPPCLRQLTEFGIPEGGRNNTMLNIGLYYKITMWWINLIPDSKP